MEYHKVTSETWIKPVVLRYPEGWKEILEAPDATDYQMWLEELVKLSTEKIQKKHQLEMEESLVHSLWQQAVEIVVDVAIMPEDKEGLTEAETIETALLTVKENIESIGWEEEGISFIVPNMETGEQMLITLGNEHARVVEMDEEELKWQPEADWIEISGLELGSVLTYRNGEHTLSILVLGKEASSMATTSDYEAPRVEVETRNVKYELVDEAWGKLLGVTQNGVGGFITGQIPPSEGMYAPLAIEQDNQEGILVIPSVELSED